MIRMNRCRDDNTQFFMRSRGKAVMEPLAAVNCFTANPQSHSSFLCRLQFFWGFFFRSFVSLFGFMVSSCFDSLSVRSFDAISSAVCSIMHTSAVTQQKHHYASVLNLDSENDLLLFSSITTYQPHPIRSQTHSRTQAPSQVIWYLFSGGGS